MGQLCKQPFVIIIVNSQMPLIINRLQVSHMTSLMMTQTHQITTHGMEPAVEASLGPCKTIIHVELELHMRLTLVVSQYPEAATLTFMLHHTKWLDNTTQSLNNTNFIELYQKIMHHLLLCPIMYWLYRHLQCVNMRF